VLAWSYPGREPGVVPPRSFHRRRGPGTHATMVKVNSAESQSLPLHPTSRSQGVESHTLMESVKYAANQGDPWRCGLGGSTHIAA